MGETFTDEELALDLVQHIIQDYIGCGLRTANTGTPDRLDSETWERCIYQIQHLHLAEPHLPAMEVIRALKLAGWAAPESTSSGSTPKGGNTSD